MTRFHLDGARPKPFNPDGTDARGRLHIDVPPVTPDEATELMTHHLQLAEAYYQATADHAVVAAEVERLMDSGISGYERPALIGARVWLATLREHYAELARRFDDRG